MLAAAVMLTVTISSPAGALCDGSLSREQLLAVAEIAFVGRVVGTSASGHTADVRVEQVWKGGPISDRVTVVGGSEDDNVVGEDERMFAAGHRYLFVPFRDGSELRDSSCTATIEYSGDVAKLAPATVSLPRRSSTGSSGVAKQAAIALGLVAAGVIAMSVAGARRRRRARSVTPS
jgi:hypothetical protein